MIHNLVHNAIHILSHAILQNYQMQQIGNPLYLSFDENLNAT